MKEFHALLPVRAQEELMAATKINLNVIIQKVMLDYPYCYHTEDTLSERVFFDQPTGIIGSAKFVNAAPRMPSL